MEVAPAADPPVCRVLDYGRFRYVQNKKEREARKAQKATALRQVRFRPMIGQHDLEAKFRTVRKLLATGAKVKLNVVFRGRTIAHPELGMVLLRKVAEGLQEEAKLEKAPGMEGRTLSIILAPISRRDSHASGRPNGGEQKVEPAEVQEDAQDAEAILATQEKGHAKAQNS